jgi:glycerol dehydrogenase-like iron-containing ADH family enzyme
MKNCHRASGVIPVNEELVFPGKVIKGEGAADNIDAGPYRAPFLFSDPYVLKTYGAGILKSNPSVKTIVFSGEVCPKESYRVRRILAEAGADCLYAIGGGKVMDLAKIVKKDVNGIYGTNQEKAVPSLKLVNIPTSASTCASMTPVSVMYDKDGAYQDTVDSATADEVIIDYNIFYKLPIGFFAAGAADAAAKYYEALAAGKTMKGGVNAMDAAAFSIAASSLQKLKELIYMRWEKFGEAERRELADLNIISSGLASCAGRYTVMGFYAHAMAYAATHIETARQYLHGEHVAAALVMQEGMLNNKKNMAEIRSMFEIIDVPMDLTAIGIKKQDLKQLFDVFTAIDTREQISSGTSKKMEYSKMEAYLYG